jgi:queuine tRNA-ribosyltransferase
MLAISKWVPVLTSESGLCLTSSNWQEAKIDTAVYYLDALLLKPGLNILKNLPNLADYTNWSGEVIINASRLKANRVGEISLKSTYDGSKISLDYPQLMALIHHLKPQRVILPSDVLKHYPQLWDSWDKNLIPYLSSNDLPIDDPSIIYGVYFQVENNFISVKEQIQSYKKYLCYVQGDLNFEQIQELNALGIPHIESELPSEYGLNGLAYANERLIDLKEVANVLSFNQLCEQCQCSTCSEKLTRAYLHHLFAHTPLLAQRFLIQHNAYYVQNYLNKN